MVNAKTEKQLKIKKTLISYVITLLLTVLILSSVFGVNYVFSRGNYNHNIAMQETYQPYVNNDFINNQSTTSIFKYGASTSNNNGCGWIAVYNISKILGLPTSIAEIINDMEVFGTSTFGFLGTNPLIYKSYFKKYGYNVNFVYDHNKFDQSVRSSDGAMLFYFSQTGGHITTVRPYDTTRLEFFNNHYIRTMDSFLETLSDRVVVLITLNKVG